MKTKFSILMLLIFLLASQQVFSTEIESNDCFECKFPPILISQNSCQITVNSTCLDVIAWRLFPPSGGNPQTINSSSTTYSFNVSGPGTYQIGYLSDCGDFTQLSGLLDVTVSCQDCAPPPGQVGFSWAFSEGSGPADCEYTFVPAYTGNGAIEGYQWTFSNGSPSISTAENPTVSFPVQATSAQVCLTILLEGAGGECPNTKICQTVPLECDPCDGFQAGFTYELDNCTLKVNPSSSSGGSGSISYYSYLVNDVLLSSGWGAPTSIWTYDFNGNGVQKVCLKIFRFGIVNGSWVVECVDEYCENIVVADCGEPCTETPGVALLELSDVEAGQEAECGEYFFLLLRSGSFPTGDCGIEPTYYIDYDDGTVCNYSAGSCATVGNSINYHRFKENGTYEVCAYAFDDCGCVGVDCQTVVVSCIPDPCEAVITEFVCETTDCDVGETGGCSLCFSSAQSTPTTGGTITSKKWRVTLFDGLDQVLDILEYNALDDNFNVCFNSSTVNLEVCLIITDSEGCEDQICVTKPNNCLPFGGNNPEFSQSNPSSSTSGFSIFPNPSTGQFSINSANDPLQSIEIYTLNGQRIWQNSRLDQTFFQYEDTPLAPGTYLIRATTMNSYFTQKLIVLNR